MAAKAHVPFSPSHTVPLNPSSTLYRVHPHHHHHHPMDHHSRYPSTCIPSLLPPGVLDPTSVDFRTFFPYIPNEVKHRKRTSRSQLKVLEETFRKDTKPNAALRKKLAAELDMLPRAVQVWFQNRRAKDKALRKRVLDSSQLDSLDAHSPQKSQSPREPSPDDSSHSSTPTEKPTHPADQDDPQSLEPHPVELESSPLTKLAVPPQPPLPWHSNPSTPAQTSPHLRHPSLQVTWQDNNDLLNSRRGSLPINMSMPDPSHPPTPFPDRRKSMDVNFLRLLHHPFARVAKEKNDAIFHRSHAGSSQRPPSGLAGPSIRTASYGSSSSSYNPYPRPPLAHRASEPHVFAPIQSSPFPNGQEVPPNSHMPRRLEHPFATSSRALPSPIPGPLPKPDFQFGAPSSVSPPHASPDADSPNLHSWAFPRNDTDQDTEDSASSIGLSRFGSIASACGSDTSATSAIYSDVSSCVGIDHIAFDPHVRRGSCASNSLLETRMSGLNMRSSQGSINEAHLKAATSLPYPHREHLLSQERGYASPASTVSPTGSPHMTHGKDPGPFGMRTSDNAFSYNSVPPESSSNTYLSPTEPAASSRRPSIPALQGITRSHIQNTLESNSSYPPPVDSAPSSNTYHFNPESSRYSHTGNYVSPSFSRDGTFSPTDASYAQPGLQYPPEGSFPPHANVAVGGGMSSYVQHSADYAFTAPPANSTGHGEEHFGTYN